MSSQIDVSKPASGAATTQSVRDNFTQAVADLKALQGESGILSIAASVAANALTLALKTSAGIDATSTTGIEVSFRNATAATGTRTTVSTVGAVSVVVPQGATLGFANSGIEFIYVYGINNAGTLEIGLSGSVKDDNTLQTSVALSATSDLDATLYSTTARTTVPIRYLGRIRVQTGATAGDWTTAPSEISSVTQYPPASGFLTSSDIGSTVEAFDANKYPAPTITGTSTTAANASFHIASAGGITITLPATPTAGNYVIIKDGTGAAETTTFTVARNGSNIASSATDLTFDKNFAEVVMTYVNSTIGWSV